MSCISGHELTAMQLYEIYTVHQLHSHLNKKVCLKEVVVIEINCCLAAKPPTYRLLQGI